MLTKNLIGIIPSGGYGKRMQPFKMWKELIPVGYRVTHTTNGRKLVPKVLAEYTMENMIRAGTKNILMIINEQKTEFIRFFGDGSEYGTSLLYTCQDGSHNVRGMPVAINIAFEWIKGKTVLMGMPDTIVEPSDCYVKLLQLMEEKKADLVLGVFPTDFPNRLAPVVIDPHTSRIKAIYDKPKKTDVYNTWNIAVWSDSFTNLLNSYVSEQIANQNNEKKEILLSSVFNLAIERDLGVYGMLFEDGECYDLGHIDEFIMTKQHFEALHFSNYNETAATSEE